MPHEVFKLWVLLLGSLHIFTGLHRRILVVPPVWIITMLRSIIWSGGKLQLKVSLFLEFLESIVLLVSLQRTESELIYASSPGAWFVTSWISINLCIHVSIIHIWENNFTYLLWFFTPAMQAQLVLCPTSYTGGKMNSWCTCVRNVKYKRSSEPHNINSCGLSYFFFNLLTYSFNIDFFSSIGMNGLKTFCHTYYWNMSETPTA